jgi:hypothetical protein
MMPRPRFTARLTPRLLAERGEGREIVGTHSSDSARFLQN